MKITIYRGKNQLEGCSLEICSGETRILIDMGGKLSAVMKNNMQCDAIFFSNTLRDNLGRLELIPTDIPLYMDGQIKERCLSRNSQLVNSSDYDVQKVAEALKRAKRLYRHQIIEIGALMIIPIRSEPYSFDSYMFHICAEGVHILCTDDFRLHRQNVKKTISYYSWFVGEIDYLIYTGRKIPSKKKGTWRQPETFSLEKNFTNITAFDILKIEDLKWIIARIKAYQGIIPVYPETEEQFTELLTEHNVIRIASGETVKLKK